MRAVTAWGHNDEGDTNQIDQKDVIRNLYRFDMDRNPEPVVEPFFPVAKPCRVKPNKPEATTKKTKKKSTATDKAIDAANKADMRRRNIRHEETND